MALIKCPDCGKDVSSIAPACPSCGRPIAKEAPKAPAQEKPKEQSTDTEAIWDFLIAGGGTWGAYYFFPNLPWWALVLIFLIALGSAYSGATQVKANETIITKGNEK